MEEVRGLFQLMTRYFGLLNKNCCSTPEQDITLVQSHILYEIDRRENPSIQQVSEALGMDITTFSRQVQTLTKEDLVKKVPYPGDRRVHVLMLTEKGQRVAKEIDEMVTANLKDIFSRMSDFEQDMVIRSIKLLVKSMEESDSCCKVLG